MTDSRTCRSSWCTYRIRRKAIQTIEVREESVMSTYVISLDEAMWGSLLVAITMAIHGTGMFWNPENHRFAEGTLCAHGVLPGWPWPRHSREPADRRHQRRRGDRVGVVLPPAGRAAQPQRRDVQRLAELHDPAGRLPAAALAPARSAARHGRAAHRRLVDRHPVHARAGLPGHPAPQTQAQA